MDIIGAGAGRPPAGGPKSPHVSDGTDQTFMTDVIEPSKSVPVIVDFWATWCGPCRVEFPELVKIDADYRVKGLNFIVVSIDNLGAMDMIVADFLKSYQSTMPSYLLDLPTRGKIFRNIRQIAPAAQNGFPLTLLYDAGGKLVYQKNGVVDAKILRARIDKVLAAK